ncbi:hypothetical protein PVAND_007104 [Polypedilum vanderplanki]|uniref:Uncharacterized protein n=1 Tax=Polypedilum vanderplanki TaxID=319348 RepID=A0A9J6C666_POLVA|nr:hypothetical protein PVAND_007104 [Polypedilum vanderplanki]
MATGGESEDIVMNEALSPFSAENRFETLSDNDDGSDFQLNDDERNRLNKRRRTTGKSLTSNHLEQQVTNQKPPPLIVLHSNIDKIKEQLLKLNITEYTLRLTSEGTRIFCSKLGEYKTLKENMISSKIPFFTHRLKDEQVTKFVLKGLHKMDTNEIKDAIQINNSKPATVQALKTKKSK